MFRARLAFCGLYHGLPHESLVLSSVYTKKIQVTSGTFHGIPKCCKTNLHHVIENAVVNTINTVHMHDEEGVKPSSVQQLFCILIGCILCGI